MAQCRHSLQHLQSTGPGRLVEWPPPWHPDSVLPSFLQLRKLRLREQLCAAQRPLESLSVPYRQVSPRARPWQTRANEVCSDRGDWLLRYCQPGPFQNGAPKTWGGGVNSPRPQDQVAAAWVLVQSPLDTSRPQGLSLCHHLQQLGGPEEQSMPRPGLVHRTHTLLWQWVTTAPSICSVSKLHLPPSESDHLGHSHTGGRLSCSRTHSGADGVLPTLTLWPPLHRHTHRPTPRVTLV